jgi:outer membrane protein TolC
VARQQLAARQADLQAASNDTLVAVTDAYFSVQQARGELAGAVATIRLTEDLVARTRKLAPELIPELETIRAEAELVRRYQAERLSLERWRVSSAELIRVLRLDPGTRVEPVEPPQLKVDLVGLDRPLDELIELALTNRPELASQQAQVQATLTLLRQEKLRPLIPSLLLRGYSTPVTGGLMTSYAFYGNNGNLTDSNFRNDIDVQVLWRLDNLGFGNLAAVHQRQAEKEQAIVELFRRQDRVAAEVAQAQAQLQETAERLTWAESGARLARESADKNLAALRQTKAGGGAVQLIVRPQEVVAAIEALGQAYSDYYGAVADFNRAQFRLYRALGQPASFLTEAARSCLPAGTPAEVLGQRHDLPPSP